MITRAMSLRTENELCILERLTTLAHKLELTEMSISFSLKADRLREELRRRLAEEESGGEEGGECDHGDEKRRNRGVATLTPLRIRQGGHPDTSEALRTQHERKRS